MSATDTFGDWGKVMKSKNYELFMWYQMQGDNARVEQRMKEIQESRMKK